MKTILAVLGVAVLVGSAQPAIHAQSESTQLQAGSTIPTMLEKWVDARKSKVGDEVIAKTTENVRSAGLVVLPKGSKIVGRVTEVRARTKEQPESAVGLVFDRAVLKDGREIPLPLEIQAIAPEASATAPMLGATPGTAGGTSGGVPPVPGQGNSMGPMSDPNAGTPGRIGSPNPVDAAGSLSPAGQLTPSCHGVLGIDGLELASATDATQGSRILSQRRNVHLDSRTQMMLRVRDK